jgi:hypothetical protein
MKPILTAIAVLGFAASAAAAATIVNKDDKPYTLIITEGGQRSEIGLGAGQTIMPCSAGCFLTLPNGDREALTGNETVEISGGRAKVK